MRHDDEPSYERRNQPTALVTAKRGGVPRWWLWVAGLTSMIVTGVLITAFAFHMRRRSVAETIEGTPATEHPKLADAPPPPMVFAEASPTPSASAEVAPQAPSASAEVAPQAPSASASSRRAPPRPSSVPSPSASHDVDLMRTL